MDLGTYFTFVIMLSSEYGYPGLLLNAKPMHRILAISITRIADKYVYESTFIQIQYTRNTQNDKREKSETI